MGVYSIYQYVLFVLSAYYLLSRTARFIRREQGQSVYKLILTYLLWLGVAFVAVYPGGAKSIILDFGVEQDIYTIVFLSFVFISIILFRIITVIENIERKITEIVREEALRDLQNKRNENERSRS